MLILSTKQAAKQLKAIQCQPSDIADACEEMQRGLIDADLGGNLYKKRIAINGRGKSGGVRTILATRFQEHWFVVTAFAKNERANISKSQLEQLKAISKTLLSLSSEEINQGIVDGLFQVLFIQQEHSNVKH